jgi:hypothetical protein
LKNDASIDEYVGQFDIFDLKATKEIKGFDPNQLFMKHMIFVGYIVSYENTFLFVEEEDEDKNHEEFPIEYIDIVVITNEPYKKHGIVINERSSHSPNVSQRSGPQK